MEQVIPRAVCNRTWVNGRQFRSIRFPAKGGEPAVILTWAVWTVKSPSVFTGALLGRRVIQGR